MGNYYNNMKPRNQDELTFNFLNHKLREANKSLGLSEGKYV